MIRLDDAIARLRRAQDAIAHLLPAVDAVTALNDIQTVIDMLRGERPTYPGDAVSHANDACNDLFGEAAERDGSAWRHKKEEKRT